MTPKTSALPNIHRILFVRTDRIGDTLMNIPALHLLRQTYPKCWLTLLCDEAVAPLFQNHPDLDEVLTVHAADLSKSFTAQISLFKKIKKASFDLAVISNPSKLFHGITFLAGIGHRVGYARKWGFLLNHTVLDQKDLGARHEIEANLDLVRQVSSVSWDGAMPFSVEDAAKKMVQKFLESGGAGEGVVALHVGTTHPGKRWGAECFADLARQISSQKKLKVALVGGPEEAETARQIADQARSPLVDVVGKLTLPELAAFLSMESVKALVSADSGPAHIAWMQGKPAVIFYAKNVQGSDPVRWGPRDGRSVVIHKNMSEITVSEAYQALQKVLCR